MAGPLRKVRLGDLLVAAGEITEEQLKLALAEQKRTGRKLGQMLVELSFTTEDRILNTLATQLQLPLVDLSRYRLKPEAVARLPEARARRLRAIVLEETAQDYLIGMADPTDLVGYDEIAGLLRRPVRVAIVKEGELLSVFENAYRRTQEISNLAEAMGEELKQGDFDVNQLLGATEVVDAPVVKLLQNLFEDAVSMGASDVHIEPDESVLRIRQRVDGMLNEQTLPEVRIASAVVLRLKLMSGLDISEKRLPQDGRFNIKVKGRSIDVRLSTMPIAYGESVVMRLLDQSGGLVGFERLGMPPAILSRFQKVIQAPHGMVLVTGPTGSGKTTTLYSALTALNSAERKIITVEDPVEYRMPRINQVQVNPKIGLSFASVLRAALRQDPDVILVGEMRDQETAEIGLRAAMTGHLVLSTLHTNDALSTADRLLDMGAEGYLVASALKAVLAQRLIRRICDNCKTPAEADPNQRAWLLGRGLEPDNLPLRHGTGCSRCNGSGYKGRIGVYEYLELDEPMLRALRRADAQGFAEAALANHVYTPLVEAGLAYVRSGLTTLDEVMRIAGQLPQDATAHRPLQSGGAMPRPPREGSMSLPPLVDASSHALGRSLPGESRPAASAEFEAPVFAGAAPAPSVAAPPTPSPRWSAEADKLSLG